MNPPHLTRVQREVLDIIGQWHDEHHTYPSLVEIGSRRSKGKSKRSVVQILTYLQDKKYLKRLGPRNFEMLPLGRACLSGELENPYL